VSAARGSASDAVFANDLARFDALFHDADAVVVEPDGFTWIDPTKVSAALLDTYCNLLSYGYANGLMP